MAKLEDIIVGCNVNGLVINETVSVIAIKWYGSNVMQVTYKDTKGNLGDQLLYRENEANLSVLDKKLPWSFDADGEMLRLVSEAYRINLAHLFDPYLAVHTSAVEPLPHQISAVYEEMLPRLPLRYILADDPGAGKTIMTGLFLKELIIRGDLKRCLIVSPGSLAEQWQDELFRKFNLRFNILTNDVIEASVTGNIFTENSYCHYIIRLDKLARNDVLQNKLKISDWDLIVVDEAHKMSATVWGNEPKYTKRFMVGRLLSSITRHFLLLTATPHNGKEQDFQLFMSLIDQDRFEGAAHTSNHSIDVSDVMRRLVKEELLKFDGTPLFPERRANTVNYTLSPREIKLYQAVTDYVEQEFNRADSLSNEHKNTVGFALTILQRRLASSPEAIYQSLRRRRERLENRLTEEKLQKQAEYYQKYDLSDYDDDDLPSAEFEELEENIADQASASTTISELEAEISTLQRLEKLAAELRTSGADRKWDELSKLLQDNDEMFSEDGQREKLIIFTEHRDTLRYLADKIKTLFGDDRSVVQIHGGMLRDERRKAEELFKQDKDVRIMIATDAAGEGINLQRAHLMVNYDLPWNPNRLEQRFGRVHRIGQTEVCHLWNLVAKETREGLVFQRLFEKLEEERNALGGKVFDILGKVSFENESLRDLLIKAVRYGNKPEVRARLWQVIDDSLDKAKLQELLEERALTEDSMDISKVMKIKENMERIEAHKLQPHFIEAFFVDAFKSVGGSIRQREGRRYEIIRVPAAVKNRDMQIGFGAPVIDKYERICFDKDDCNLQGQKPAELICPGHPLLEATLDLVLERNFELLKHGTIYIDDSDYGTEARLLFYIEDSIQDGVILENGAKRIISKNLHFVEMQEDGTAKNAGYAPYLDYRSATQEETAAILDFARTQSWLTNGVEDLALQYAIAEIVPQHFNQVRQHKNKMLDKIAKAVKERLTSEVQYWDNRANTLAEKESSGKINAKLNSQNARKRADDLEARLHKRIEDIEKEKMISATPPNIVGGALIIPKGLLHILTGKPLPDTFGQTDKQAIEYAAMKAVMDIESELGYLPKDVSALKCGYDIESKIPEEIAQNGFTLRMIEVKGRAKGATSVTVSKNEILTALNKPNEYILAIVEVDGEQTHTTYLKQPFKKSLDFAATSVNFNIKELIDGSEVLYGD